MKPRRQSNFSTARFRPERPLLDEIQERHAQTAVPLRDGDHEAQVRLDHHALGDRIAALDALRERYLFGSGEQLVAADIGEEQLEAVGRAGDGAGLVLLLGGLFLLGVEVGLRDLDVVRLELALEQLGVFLADVVLEHERFELGRPRAGLRAPRRAPMSAFTCSDSKSSMSWFCVNVLFQSFRSRPEVRQTYEAYGVFSGDFQQIRCGVSVTSS